MSEEKKRIPKTISRRDFLKDAGLIVGGAAIGSTVLLAACGGDGEVETVTVSKTVTAPGGTKTVTTTAGEVTKTVTTTAPGGTSTVTKTVEGPGGEAAANVVSFTVNGQEYKNIPVKPHWTLKNLLHDQLGFLEIKTMCDGRGQCGSCTVIMDGRPILSCMTLAATCDGVEIETSTSLIDSNHPLIETYIKHQCMQCGYCTPGFIITAKALLDKNSDPTEEEIILALEGNLCRCSSYPAHVPAVLEAAAALKGGK